MKNLKTNWDLMYRKNLSSPWTIFNTIYCKDPYSTNEYKKLEKKLINNEVSKILCEVSLPF